MLSDCGSFGFLYDVSVVEGGGCGVKGSGVVCGFVVEYLSETLCLESVKPVEVLLCECSRFHAVCDHWDKHGVEDLQFPGCGYVGVAPKLVEVLESRSAFSEFLL